MDLTPLGKYIDLNNFSSDIMSDTIQEYQFDYKDKIIESRNLVILKSYCITSGQSVNIFHTIASVSTRIVVVFLKEVFLMIWYTRNGYLWWIIEYSILHMT